MRTTATPALSPAKLKLQASATITAYDWDQELIRWLATERQEDLDPDLMPMWSKVRSDKELLRKFIDTAFFEDLKAEECSWPDPIILTAGDASIESLAAALGTTGMDFNEWLWPLAACIRVEYDQATFESPFSPPKQVSLRGLAIDEYRSGRPKAGKCIGRRSASFSVEMNQSVSQNPNWGRYEVEGTTRDRLMRLLREVHEHTAMFNGVRLSQAIWEAYDSNGCDEGHFSQIIKRFAAPELGPQEEHDLFKQVFEKLPEGDRKWYAEIMADESGDGFSIVVGFVLHSITNSVGGTTLTLTETRRGK
ncbi:MAG TPA: hypothetical protein VM578_12365 [Candidatus Saccharimonadales bacterium]|nr:hypothetical protein [Candidatus Saccharimonadales bacterium]